MLKYVFCITSQAHANVGLPMLAVIWPLFIVMLVPVIAIESFVFRRKIPEFSLKTVIQRISIANILSTLIGIPLTWGALVLVQLSLGGGGSFPHLTPLAQAFLSVTLQAAWLLPDEGHLHWMIPLAFLFLMLFFFLTSVLSERWVVNNSLKKMNFIDKKRIDEAVFWSNVWSYVFLIIVALIVFLCFKYKILIYQ